MSSYYINIVQFIEFGTTEVVVHGLTNAIAPVPANTDPSDWVFATVNRVQLNRGDAKYIYVPAKAPCLSGF